LYPSASIAHIKPHKPLMKSFNVCISFAHDDELLHVISANDPLEAVEQYCAPRYRKQASCRGRVAALAR